MPGTGKTTELRLGKLCNGTPIVTQVDPATGKTQNIATPAYTDAASQASWKSLFDQLRTRLAARGLEKAMQLGRVSDVVAIPEIVGALKTISGGLPWANAGHYVRPAGWSGVEKFGYQAGFFSTRFAFVQSLHGWREPELVGMFERACGVDCKSPSRWKIFPEMSVTGNTRGIARLGADAWTAIRDANGLRKDRVWERYPKSDTFGLCIEGSVLAPGADSAVSTQRLEALREGAQECEAIIVLEKAMLEKKLDADTAKRCQDLLNERLWQAGTHYVFTATSWRGSPALVGGTWFLGSGWQQRSEKLYTLAGEVQKKLPGN